MKRNKLFRYHDIFQVTETPGRPMYVGSVEAASPLEAVIQLATDRLDRDADGLNLKLYPVLRKDLNVIYRPGIDGWPLYSATTDRV